ncbi:MAG: hypothetical protein ACYTHJ_05970 [Planctomycetota bacterium]|jgi:hypothetical protein
MQALATMPNGGSGDTCLVAIPAVIGDNAFNTTTNTNSGLPVEGHCIYMGEMSKDIWFSHSFAADGVATVSTCQLGSFDTSIMIYEAVDGCDSLAFVAGNGDAALDDMCQAYHSEQRFVVKGAVDYFVRVGGYGASEGGPGNMNLSFVEQPNPCNCDPGDPDCPSAYVLDNPFPIPGSIEVATNGIFAIWWDGDFNHAFDTPTMFNQLNGIREDCLTNLGMEDPPNPGECFYYNVYIHHGPDDDFPDWGNGQGTDGYCRPYLTLPAGLNTDEANTYHEGFHIFQYSANSPGFALSDAGWYTEAAAQWYMADNMPGAEAAFVEAGAIIANPQLALWHAFDNQAPGDPTDWLYQVRQYGMHTLLYYLTEVGGVEANVLTDGYYNGTQLRPQEYLYAEIGGESFRQLFADWAAHNTAGLDYLTPAQVERALEEAEAVGDPDNFHNYVAETSASQLEQEWIYQTCSTPDRCFSPRSWAYNVIRIANDTAGRYTFQLSGQPTGSDGAPSHFEGRVVVMGANGPRIENMTMANHVDGMAVVDVTAADADVFLVVVATPEQFTGNQTYGFTVQGDFIPGGIAVPALSNWGVIALMLLTFVVGTVSFRRMDVAE